MHGRTPDACIWHGIDSWDEYLRISESTCGDAMVRYATTVVEVFGPQYLREPTVADTERLLTILEARWWTCLLGSLDCMHWKMEELSEGFTRVISGSC